MTILSDYRIQSVDRIFFLVVCFKILLGNVCVYKTTYNNEKENIVLCGNLFK